MRQAFAMSITLALSLIALCHVYGGSGRLSALLQSSTFNPAALSGKLAQISSAQTAVLREQEKLPGFRSAANQQQLIVKDLPFRLSGYTVPGGAPAPSPYSSQQNAGPARLNGYSQPGTSQ